MENKIITVEEYDKALYNRYLKVKDALISKINAQLSNPTYSNYEFCVCLDILLEEEAVLKDLKTPLKEAGWMYKVEKEWGSNRQYLYLKRITK